MTCCLLGSGSHICKVRLHLHRVGSGIRGIRHLVPCARLEFIGELLVALLEPGKRAELRAKAWLAGGIRGQRASAIAPGPCSSQACCKALPQFRGLLSGVCEGVPATFLPVVTAAHSEGEKEPGARGRAGWGYRWLGPWGCHWLHPAWHPSQGQIF